MHKCSLSVHQVKLMVESREDFSDGSGVADHADSSHNFGQVSSRHNCGGLIVDSDLEPCRAPIHKLYGSFGFDSRNGSIDILWYDVASVHHRAGHILAMSWVAFGHHVGGLEGGVCDFSDRELLVVCFLG